MTNQYGLWTEEKREKGEVQRMSGATKAEDMQGGQVNLTYCAALSFKSPQSQTSTLVLELHVARVMNGPDAIKQDGTIDSLGVGVEPADLVTCSREKVATNNNVLVHRQSISHNPTVLLGTLHRQVAAV